FCTRVQAATGQAIRTLSGDEEANLIGRGLTSDPALADLRDFYVFDLGGGSLECLAFRDRRIESAVSLQVGCVRLTEKFVADPAAPVDPATLARIKAHARNTLTSSAPSFKFSLPPTAVAIASGGTMSTVRAIRGARDGIAFEKTDSTIAVSELQSLLHE